MEHSKKILYLTRYAVHQEFNLKKKFDGQIAAFSNLGFDVYYIGYDEKYLYLIHNNEKTIVGKTHFRIPAYLHTQFYNDLHNVAVKTINEIGFDYIYWRIAPIFRSSCKVAEKAKASEAKLIIEIPTFPSDKENNTQGIRKLFSLYSKKYSKKFRQLVDVYAVIGEDAGGENKGKPAINFENGIDINSIRIRKPRFDKNAINILAVSAMRYWHGYDRIIRSIGNYRGGRRVNIHLVGGLDGECTNEWKQLAKDLNISEQVIFHGYLYGEELDDLADVCDLGCSSLRRNNYAHVSELKTREYTARGLPFILSLDDSTFSNADKQFYHLISNDGSIPDMNDIVDFALKMRNDDIVPYMRSFAEEHLTWETQYKKLFSEIEKICED